MKWVGYLKYKYLGIHFTNNDLLNKKPINLEFEISNTFLSDLYVLGLNSDTWVVVWTLVAQVVVVITNYVFSKLIVFKNKEKEEK